MVGLATLLGVTATRRVLQPLDRVVATTRQIAAGDLKQRVGLPAGRTEIAQLGAAFDIMVARLETAFAAQRRFVADAAHELRTPLTALSTSVELLLMGAADNDRATAQRLLRHLDSELSRVIRLTNDLLTLSQLDARPKIALRPTDLSSLLEEVGEDSRDLLRGQELILDVTPGLWIQGELGPAPAGRAESARQRPQVHAPQRADHPAREFSVFSFEFYDNSTGSHRNSKLRTQNSKLDHRRGRRYRRRNRSRCTATPVRALLPS